MFFVKLLKKLLKTLLFTKTDNIKNLLLINGKFYFLIKLYESQFFFWYMLIIFMALIILSSCCLLCKNFLSFQHLIRQNIREKFRKTDKIVKELQKTEKLKKK